MNMLTISPIRAFSDNYIWLIVRNNQAFVVDPGEPGPVLAALEAAAIKLSGILVTHHHFDHVGGNQKLKEKYRAIRDQKIKERVEALGVEVQQGDDREVLLEKEKQYTLERQKIENCLESFYRSSVSLCFQINKRYIPKHRSILRVIDLRFEQSEIYIRWDDASEEDWLLLIYIKNNSPEEGIVIEDKTDPEKNISHEFKTTEIFKASDMMVDLSLIHI